MRAGTLISPRMIPSSAVGIYEFSISIVNLEAKEWTHRVQKRGEDGKVEACLRPLNEGS